MVVSWIMGLIVTIFWLLVTGLISFHVFLICNETTTYQYLISSKKAKVAPDFN